MPELKFKLLHSHVDVTKEKPIITPLGLVDAYLKHADDTIPNVLSVGLCTGRLMLKGDLLCFDNSMAVLNEYSRGVAFALEQHLWEATSPVMCGLLMRLGVCQSFGFGFGIKEHGKGTCPECLAPGAYIGFTDVACINKYCRHFKEVR